MIRGAEDGRRFVVADYSEDQVEKILDQFLNKVQKDGEGAGHLDTRLS